MTRRSLSVLALVALLGLTGATFFLADGGSGAAVVAGVAVVKMGVIGGVFLELYRAHPGWWALGAAVLAVLGGGTVLLMGA